LGGLIVKEVSSEMPVQDFNPVLLQHVISLIICYQALRLSERETDWNIRDIVNSTAGVTFIGTPHCGADGMSLEDVVQRAASLILQVDINALLLRPLGLDGPELELSRESFTGQWRIYDFRVKTFQEVFSMFSSNEKVSKHDYVAMATNDDLYVLTRLKLIQNQVVPYAFASFDDSRDCPETILAHHEGMCKFKSFEDVGYLKVSREIKSALQWVNQRKLEQKQGPKPNFIFLEEC
jgi:hypothetical protein